MRTQWLSRARSTPSGRPPNFFALLGDAVGFGKSTILCAWKVYWGLVRMKHLSVEAYAGEGVEYFSDPGENNPPEEPEPLAMVVVGHRPHTRPATAGVKINANWASGAPEVLKQTVHRSQGRPTKICFFSYTRTPRGSRGPRASCAGRGGRELFSKNLNTKACHSVAFARYYNRPISIPTPYFYPHSLDLFLSRSRNPPKVAAPIH